eukprot:jgi/Picsp_1/3055/NSC_01277-R1_biotin--protein ligase-like
MLRVPVAYHSSSYFTAYSSIGGGRVEIAKRVCRVAVDVLRRENCKSTIENRVISCDDKMSRSSILCNSCCIFTETEDDLSRVKDLIQRTGVPKMCGSAGREDEGAEFDLHYSSIELMPNEDICRAKWGCGSFDPASYFKLLRTQNMGRALLSSEETVSTQTALQQNAGRLPVGTLFVSDRQIGGKGRGGNVWASPDGCVMFSLMHTFKGAGQRLPFVQYIVSLAVVQTVQSLGALKTRSIPSCQDRELLNIRIKWPNDLYDGESGLKIGGILCHSAFRDAIFQVTIGIGLNVSNQEPTTCLNDMLKLYAGTEDVQVFTREEIVAGVANRLEGMLETLTVHGFSGFESEYYTAWLHSGQEIRAQCDGDMDRYEQVKVIGLSQNGYLLATDESGHRFELHPDGNSLDFMNGLLRKKVN